MGGRSCERFAYAAAEGVVGERHFLAVGAHDAGEHAVALPVVTPTCAESAETDAKLGFEPLLINGSDDVTAQRHLLELLEHKVALAVVVVEELVVFGQPFHQAAALVLGRDEVVELVVVVPRATRPEISSCAICRRLPMPHV